MSIILTGDEPITETLLETLGFEFRDLGDESPYEVWVKEEVVIWDMNGDHWVVDMLDQAGFDAEFRTIGELDLFFRGCQKAPLFRLNENDGDHTH